MGPRLGYNMSCWRERHVYWILRHDTTRQIRLAVDGPKGAEQQQQQQQPPLLRAMHRHRTYQD